ncbi:hypothetical protein Fmac_012158 [Flemingia macrophylla]|uniref:BHLH domain-containing protein n=1 Tax=Flemingia macrophylla TaxID=520843 RepID=A0ABD1MQC3_9FABA
MLPPDMLVNIICLMQTTIEEVFGLSQNDHAPHQVPLPSLNLSSKPCEMDHNPPASNPASSAGSSSKASRNKEIKKGMRKCKGVKLSTDPQSVAARERRHRISDRFKILQSMVPGGGKMDTVSMLEEAIQYVKFLKAQIWLHQTMINFMDDHNDSASPSPSPMYLTDLRECCFPSEQHFVAPQLSSSLDYGVQNLPHVPLAQCSFQGEDTTCFDALCNICQLN